MNRSIVLVQGLGLGVLYVLFYRSLVPGLVKDWSTYSNFTYGVVVPFISSYLIWHRRTQFQSLPVNPTLLAAIPPIVGSRSRGYRRGCRGSVHDEGVDDLSSWKFDLSIIR